MFSGFDPAADPAGDGNGRRRRRRVVVAVGFDHLRRIADDHGDRIARRVAQRQLHPARSQRRVRRQRQRGGRSGRQSGPDQPKSGFVSARDACRMDVHHQRTRTDLDAVHPIGVALVPHVADFQQIIACLFKPVAEKRVAKEKIVRGGDCRPTGVAERQDRIHVLLQVVDPILQPHRADVEVELRAGGHVEFEKIHVLRPLDDAAQRAGDGDHLRCSAESFLSASGTTGSRTITSWPSVLAPRGVAKRKSRTPGWASAATVNFTLRFVTLGSLPLSSGLASGGMTSPVTPSPVTSTWYAPYMLYRELSVCSEVCPTWAATGRRLISIG